MAGESEINSSSNKEKTGKFRAALVDLDGLLVNSEELYLEANQIYFKKEFNFEFSEDLHRRGTGRRFEEWIKTVIDTSKSGQEILRERNEVYFELAKEKLKLMPGASNLLNMLRKHYKLALVATSRRDYVDQVLIMTGIEDCFDVVLSGDDVKRAKPDPEPYLVAAQKLGVEPAECVVFEDAPTGILSAKSASMKVVAVPSKFVRGDSVFNKADLVLGSLAEVDLDKINSLS